MENLEGYWVIRRNGPVLKWFANNFRLISSRMTELSKTRLQEEVHSCNSKLTALFLGLLQGLTPRKARRRFFPERRWVLKSPAVTSGPMPAGRSIEKGNRWLTWVNCGEASAGWPPPWPTGSPSGNRSWIRLPVRVWTKWLKPKIGRKDLLIPESWRITRLPAPDVCR